MVGHFEGRHIELISWNFRISSAAGKKEKKNKNR